MASSSRRHTTRRRTAATSHNPPHGGPADTDVTGVVEKNANRYIEAGLKGVARDAV